MQTFVVEYTGWEVRGYILSHCSVKPVICIFGTTTTNHLNVLLHTTPPPNGNPLARYCTPVYYLLIKSLKSNMKKNVGFLSMPIRYTVIINDNLGVHQVD